MRNTGNRGFTLIELLVVIAIIGILAAVVLTSLNSARDKARDASAESSFSSVRSQAEIYFSDNDGYGDNSAAPITVSSDAPANSDSTVCSDDNVENLLGAIYEQTGNDITCQANGDSYTVHGDLNADAAYCVDSTGFAGRIGAGGSAPATQGASCE